VLGTEYGYLVQEGYRVVSLDGFDAGSLEHDIGLVHDDWSHLLMLLEQLA